MNKLNTIFIALILSFSTHYTLSAQGTYYDGVEAQVANGLNCMPLKQALHDLIDGHTERDYYSDLPGFMCTYDVDANGDILDRYKGVSVGACSSSSTSLPSGLNREHVMPKSWWGGSTTVIQFSDYHNLFPSDAGTNGDKSNYPLGYVSTSFGGYPYTTFPMTNIGDDGLPCTDVSTSSFDDNVFEPDPAYMGDMARAQLYMAVRYQDEIISQNWDGISTVTSSVFSNDILTIYEPCYLDLLLQWHNQDPPDQTEINRNNGAALGIHQGNRNPFIDHPEYADLIWNTPCSTTPNICTTTLDNCDWTEVPVTTNSASQGVWTCDATGAYNINAFVNSNAPSEQWLVYGPLNMNGLTVSNLILDITEGFSGPELEFLWNASTASPTAAGWNSIGFAGNSSVTGYTVDYSPAIGNGAVYIGIKYMADGDAGGTHSFTIENFIYEYDCCANVDLSIRFDGFPFQTSWEILDDNANIIASNTGTYPNSNANTTLIENACLADGCYTLNIRDAIGNGLCPFKATAASSGTFITPGTFLASGSVVATLGSVVAPGLCGNFNLTDSNGTILAAGGGQFGAVSTHDFCITNGVAARTAPALDQHHNGHTTLTSDLRISPNPATDFIRIDVTSIGASANNALVILDINGKIVRTIQGDVWTNNSLNIDVSDLVSGTYFVQFNDEYHRLTEKFIKL